LSSGLAEQTDGCQKQTAGCQGQGDQAELSNFLPEVKVGEALCRAA